MAGTHSPLREADRGQDQRPDVVESLRVASQQISEALGAAPKPAKPSVSRKKDLAGEPNRKDFTPDSPCGRSPSYLRETYSRCTAFEIVKRKPLTGSFNRFA